MSTVAQPERATQNRVLALFRDELGWRLLGDWSDRVGNANIEENLLSPWLAKRGDSDAQAYKLLAKLLQLRIFSDAAGKMNLSVQDVAGGLLLVSQFTLAADTGSGNRPGFSGAAAPDDGRRLYDHFVPRARSASRGGHRALGRRHAGAPGQRRPGHHPDAKLNQGVET